MYLRIGVASYIGLLSVSTKHVPDIYIMKLSQQPTNTLIESQCRVKQILDSG